MGFKSKKKAGTNLLKKIHSRFKKHNKQKKNRLFRSGSFAG